MARSDETRVVVLVVDDDVSMGRAIGREIMREFACREAHTFAEAFEVLVAEPCVGAVVSDLDLGGGPSGLDFLDVVRSRVPGCARILVTGSPLAEGDRSRLMGTGLAHHIVSKPWPPGAVRVLVRSELAARGTRTVKD